MDSRTKNLTQGSPFRLLLSFSLPLMLGNIFQQLYTVVDTIIVGQVLHVQALAALGASDWLNWLMLGLVQGLSQGFGIPMAHAFGAKDTDSLKKTIAASVKICIVSAMVLTLAGQLLLTPVLKLLQTPDSIIANTRLYLRYMFMGIPIIMAYNLLACILRALGDAKTPLNAMIVAAMVNIGLDLLLVAVFPFGIAGAAVATLIAQCVSALYCYLHLRKSEYFQLSRADFAPDFKRSLKLLGLGAPMAMQNTMIALGGMIVQSVVNGFEVVFIAGFTATNKLYGVLEIAATSYGYAIVTYTSQNMGAGRLDRVKNGTKAATGLSLLTSLVIAVVMLLGGKLLLRGFISGTPEEISGAMYYAYRYLALMSFNLPILYILYVFRSATQGMGDTVKPMLSGVAEFIMRLTGVMLLPSVFGCEGTFFAEIAAWYGADLVLIPSYFITYHKIRKSLQKPSV